LTGNHISQKNSMKPSSIFNSISPALKYLALVLGVSAAFVAASARAATTTSSYILGPAGNGTFFAGDSATPWIDQGDLPVGSFLRAVSINATLEDNPGGSWASDLNVLVDGILQIGSDGGSIDWGNGQDDNVGATVIDTKTSGVDFPATIDLNTANLFLRNTWGDATWSGTVTVTYDIPEVAAISSFGLPQNPATIQEYQIVMRLPSGTNVTALAPTFTLSPGATCDHISGTAYDFSSPVHYVVTSADQLTIREYTVTALVETSWGMINVNFDIVARTGLVGPAGGGATTWNQCLASGWPSADGLSDSCGAPTFVGYTCDALEVGSWGAPALEMLTGGGFQWQWDTPTTLKISGLNPGSKYNLYLASFHPNELGGRSLFSTTNPTTTQGTQIADNFGRNGNDHAWVQGLNYVRFDNIEPDSANCITITLVGDSGTSEQRAYLSGFQLIANPATPADPYAEWIATFDFSAFTDPDLTPTGDPDGDGITNEVEYAYELNPNLSDEFPNGLTRECWDFIAGGRVADLTGNRGRFLNASDELALVPNVNDSGYGGSSACRYRGFLTAPVTGTYHFWISGNAEAELWLADGIVKQTLNSQPTGPGNPLVSLTNRYGKLRVASIEEPHGDRNFTAPLEFDKYPSQQSRPVKLVAGESYYFEVLHKRTEDRHVAVAWQIPGSTRQIIPTEAFSADATQADDHDDDNLPDVWEAQYGLNPDDNGRLDAGDGQYGDWDSDGLTNLGEFQLGTDPKKSDTDNDGLTDKAERDFYHTNPLVSNRLVYGPTTAIPAHNYASVTGHWTRDSAGTLTALDRRGEIAYPFAISSNPAEASALQPGVLEVKLSGGAAGIPRSTEKLPLVFFIDGNRFATATLVSLSGGNATVSVLTPFLKAGNHTLTVLHDNYRADLKLRISSITLRNVGGEDQNNNQRPDWLDQRLAAENGLSRIPTTSLTSPVCVEGNTSDLAGLTLAVGNNPLVPQTSVDSSFYANVPLSESSSTILTASFQSGSIIDSRNIDWLATNLFTHDSMDIRQGDSLRLDAWTGSSPSGTFTVTLNGILLTNAQSGTTHTSGQPFKVTFETPGTHTLTAILSDQSVHHVTLRVRSASFGPGLGVRANYKRYWTPANLPADLVIEGDSRLNLKEDAAASARSFWVTPYEAGTRHVLVRLPESAHGAPGAILTRGTVNAFYFAFIDETADPVVVTTYPDGTQLMRDSIVVVGLPPDIVIRLTCNYQGTIFVDGSTQMDLTAADFDQNGVAQIYYEHPGVGDPYMCTFVNIYTTAP